jgi:hypothetical protein
MLNLTDKDRNEIFQIFENGLTYVIKFCIN